MADTLATQGLGRPNITIDTLCVAQPLVFATTDTRHPPSPFAWIANHHIASTPSPTEPSGRRPYGSAALASLSASTSSPSACASASAYTPASASSSAVYATPSSCVIPTPTSATSVARYSCSSLSSPSEPSTRKASCTAGIASSLPSPLSATSSSSRRFTPRSASKKAAMSGRPGSKRPADGHGHGDEIPGQGTGAGPHGAGGKVKLPRLEREREDFSTVIKNRLSSYTRTGQACDRCKVRKIRCDALPEGCSHCANLNLDCYVTDRVTGRTEKRGYMQELEREKSSMMQHIQDLERLLQEKGVEVKPWQSPMGDEISSVVHDPSSTDNWSQFGCVWVRNGSASTASTTRTIMLQNLSHSKLESRPQESRIGVVEDNAPLSSIAGTRLSIFGTYIDTASFDAPDVDEPPEGTQIPTPLYNKSVQAFLQSSMRVNPPVHVDLPSREQAFTYADWYFLTIARWVPILHRPSFMLLLTKIYDDPHFKPSDPELVIVHMVFATILFQYAVRNWQQTEQRNQLNDQSNKHYHFALSKIFDLLCSRDFISVQAMALIASHTRAFPKPGCGAIVANLALQRAIDLNLHRSPKKTDQGTNLQIEMHKRVWWTILMVVVAITGRQGCPIPISIDEFDTEFPEPIADELLTNEGFDTSRTVECSYLCGLAGIKITPIFMQMYSSIYSVKRNAATYVDVVKCLERQLRDWRDDLPESLRLPESGEADHTNIAAFYVKTFELELRLCFRHPSMAMTTDKQMMSENSSICEESAREFLHCVGQIQKMKSLDTTWYQTSVYAACIFSMLVPSWERRFETTPEQIEDLRREMNSWMAVLKETCGLIGSGISLTAPIEQIIERTIGWIEHDMQSQTSKEPISAPIAIKQEQLPPQPQAYQAPPQMPEPSSGASQPDEPSKAYYQDLNLSHQAPYPALAYQTQSNAGPSTYQPEAAMYYNAAPQHTALAAAAPVPGQSTNSLAGYAPQAPQHVAPQPPADMMWHGRANPWHDWTAAIMGAQDQERYSANALLTLGGGPRASVPPHPQALADSTTVGQSTGDMGLVPHGAQWPLIVVDHGATSGS